MQSAKGTWIVSLLVLSAVALSPVAAATHSDDPCSADGAVHAAECVVKTGGDFVVFTLNQLMGLLEPVLVAACNIVWGEEGHDCELPRFERT